MPKTGLGMFHQAAHSQQGPPPIAEPCGGSTTRLHRPLLARMWGWRPQQMLGPRAAAEYPGRSPDTEAEVSCGHASPVAPVSEV